MPSDEDYRNMAGEDFHQFHQRPDGSYCCEGGVFTRAEIDSVIARAEKAEQVAANHWEYARGLREERDCLREALERLAYRTTSKGVPWYGYSERGVAERALKCGKGLSDGR